MPAHLVIGMGLTIGAVATATAVVCGHINRHMTRVEDVTWRLAAVDHEILDAVRQRPDTAQFN